MDVMRNIFSLLLLGSIFACSSAEAPKANKEKKPHLVEAVEVSRDSLQVLQSRTGTLRTLREVKIFTQEEGKLVRFPYYEGDKISEGDTLAELDAALLQAQWARAVATRKQAEEDSKRLEKLRGRKLVSEDEYTRSLTQLEVAKADESVLRTRLGYTRIRSPINGVVTERISEMGNVVERLQHILTIADFSTLRTELAVSELLLPHLQVGTSAQVRIDALGDKQHKGKISRIHPRLDPLTRRGIVEVELDPVPAGALPGQLCRVEFATALSARLVIPFAALRRESDNEYVFVLTDGGEVQRQSVQSGLQLAEKVEIISGLALGQRVVTKGFLGLAPGMKVQIVTQGRPSHES